MELQTKITLQPQLPNQIDYNSSILLLGSCFVDNIGKKLDYHKFQNLQNPFGILFHPIAIEKLITNAINEKQYTVDDIFFQNEQWSCFDAHSKLSSISKLDLLNTLNQQIKSTNQHIKESSHLIITLGTAWIYRFIETDSIVANCHKVLNKKFLKELLSVDQLTETLQAIISLIRSVNTKATIIFTVSPIRHIKDGFIENTQSKAHLISAIHQILNQQSSIENRLSFYFPSYELMMDELRDYRFYAKDMVHPSETAVNYIWEKFKNVWISNKSYQLMDEVDDVQKGLAHKPFNSKSATHAKFLENLEVKKLNLNKRYAHIIF